MTLKENTYRLGEALQAWNFRAMRAALLEMVANGNAQDGSYFVTLADAAQTMSDKDFRALMVVYMAKERKWWPLFGRYNLKGEFSWQ